MLSLFCFVALAGSPAAAQELESVPVLATPLPEPLSLPDDFEWVGGLAFTSEDTRIGGISGIAAGVVPAEEPGQLPFFLATDSGNLLRGDLAFDLDEEFRLKLVELVGNNFIIQRLYEGQSGAWARQAEALTSFNNRLAVGFEGEHRVGILQNGTQVTDLPVPIALRGAARSQGGIEALATLPDGRLFAVSEGVKREGGLRAWLYESGAEDWPILVYEWDESFAPTGADVTPDGLDLVLTERKFVSMRQPLQNRLVSVPVSDVQEGARLQPEIILDLDPILGPIANVEAVSVVPTSQPDQFLVLVATDNNFISLLPSMLAVLLWRRG